VKQERALEVDKLVAEWITGRTLDDAMAILRAADVAAAPVYDAPQLLADEHIQARGSFVRVDDPDLGPTTVQAPVVQMSETPGAIEHLGRALGADNDTVYRELLGLGDERLAELRESGVI
jgi:crotonobetainyl-CoA:carnitine CoA-transferase CaiB-like acyl-CoA transferase